MLKAQKVQWVQIKQGNNFQGYFIKRDGMNWEETSTNPDNVRFKFEQKYINDWSIYLYDESRDVTILLYLDILEIQYAVEDNPLRAVYSIGNYGDEPLQ